MSDIFISYASEDRERVKSMAHALERKGWSVWWDRRIPTGRSFDEVIEEALDAAKAVVVVWTKASVNSTWVKNEARKGMRRGVLFPVLLLEEVKIPLEFEHLQAAHLMDWRSGKAHAGFDQFLEDLDGFIGTSSSTVVQPPPFVPPQEPTQSFPESFREGFMEEFREQFSSKSTIDNIALAISVVMVVVGLLWWLYLSVLKG
ncbi:MAG: toll/interleukin-1 receptor domain-containing protein [Nitrospira sp.]|nr:toll/interleukin-1 receptor domain-containing protein [Nitrospira sp.]